MISVELAKQLRRWRTPVLFLVTFVVTVVISVGLGASANSTLQGLADSGEAILINSSGLAVGITALLYASSLLIPVVFAVTLGEPLAAEARWGSLRYLLVRPIGRTRLLGGKLVVGGAIAVGTVLVVPIVATLIGTAYFGWHPVASAGDNLAQGAFPLITFKAVGAGTTTWHLLVASLYVCLGSGALVGVAVLVAVLSDNVLAAVASGISTYIVSDIFDAITPLHPIWPILPTHYYDRWVDLFLPGTSLTGMLYGVISQVGWLTMTLGAAFVIFARRDILV